MSKSSYARRKLEWDEAAAIALAHAKKNIKDNPFPPDIRKHRFYEQIWEKYRKDLSIYQANFGGLYG
jgi:hypothetical protein